MINTKNNAMENQDFTTTILVDQTPQEVFNAINDPRGWWSENIEGSTDTLHSEFAYHYKDIHRCRIKIIELIPVQRVVWHVLDNYFNFTADETEWKDTKIIFGIAQKDDKTAVRFTHQGLVPQYECFDICNEAWNHYINVSLRGLITTGKGLPTPKEGDSFNSKLVEKWELE
jgi:hypothetical protein